METNQELNQVLFSIDYDWVPFLEALKIPYVKTESVLEIFCILKSSELKEYFSINPQEFCRNVFNPEMAQTCCNFRISKAKPEEYKEYLDFLDKIEEYFSNADYENMLKKVDQWVAR